MSTTLDEQIKQLRQTIVDIESQRSILGDEAVEASLKPIRQKLAVLSAQIEPLREEPQEIPIRQRKLVTLLYMDVVGSTAMTQGLDPEDTMDILEMAILDLAAPIEVHGGHVTRYTGDGFKAIFGNPIAREDDPEQAIRAGLEILEVSKGLAKEIEKEWDIEGFQVRIGIDTGLAAIGGQTEAEDTVKGRVVNLAVRIESAAPPGGLLISHNTYRHVRGVFNVDPLEPITAKGFPEPVPVYLVRELKPRAFRVLTRGVEGVETRMIGRHGELKFLQDALVTALEEGEGHVMTVSGEAGVGKSRLLYEFQNWLELLPPSQAVRFFQGRGRQEAQGLPYSMLRDMFAFRFQILDDDSGEQARQKIETGFCGVFGQDEGGIMRAHILGQVLGFDFSASPQLKGVLNDPEQLRNRGVMYLVQYFQAFSQDTPVVIVLEDLHWVDESSLEMVNRLREYTPELPLLIIGAARPTLFEIRPDWCVEKIYHTHLNLHPLSEQDSIQLMDEILKLVEEIPTNIQEVVISKSEGNPFYMEELIKILIEDGVIIPGEEIWQIELDRLKEIDVPSTLAGVLQARLDSLPPHERLVLQQASVVGRLFWDRIVAYIQTEGGNGGDPQLISQALTSISNRELVYRHEESAFIGAVEYLFKHDVLREVTYDSVLKRLRKIYHGLAADWLISNCGDRMGEYSGLIAEHLMRANDEEKACEYFLLAGKASLNVYANREAENYFRCALEIEGEHLKEADLLSLIGESLYRQSRYHESVHTWQESIQIYSKLGNYDRVGELYARSARATWMNGDPLECLRLSREGLDVVEKMKDTPIKAMLIHEVGRAYHFNGHPDEAKINCQRALDIAKRVGSMEVQADTLATLGILSSISREESIVYLKEAAILAESINELEIATRANHNLGFMIYENLGNLELSCKYFLQAADIAQQRGEAAEEIYNLRNAAGISFDLGERNKAQEILTRINQIRSTLHDPLIVKIDLMIIEYQLELLKGNFQKALDMVQWARMDAMTRSDLQWLSHVCIETVDLYLLLDSIKHVEDWSEAEEAAKEAIELSNRGFNISTKSYSQLVMIYIRKGSLDKARQLFHECDHIFGDLPTFWQKQYLLNIERDLARAEKDWQLALNSSNAASRHIAQSGMRLPWAISLIEWAEIYKARGREEDYESAKDKFLEAQGIFKEMEADFYINHINQRLKSLRV